MKHLIKQKLQAMEKNHEVKIYYACESGSRAWGFPSPNSDYDVRFIYSHGLDWHLSLRDRNESIELPIEEQLDISGWEIKKTLHLLSKSNVPLLEWLQSPLVYQVDTQFLNDLRALSYLFFSPIAALYHYLSLSKKYFAYCQEGKPLKLKQYFYALRTAIAGKWIREQGTMPPTELPKILNIVPTNISHRIHELIVIKSVQNEDYRHPAEPLINDFLQETLLENVAVANTLTPAKGDMDALENFYRRVVKST